MVSDVLEGIFGTKARARLIRFFVLNGSEWHDITDITEKNKLRREDVRKVLSVFANIKFVLEKTQKRKKVYSLNQEFPLYSELFHLVSAASRYPQCQGLKRIRQIGDVKLVMVSGVFLNYAKGKIDILIVANNVIRQKVTSVMQNIEAEIGKEIRYVLLDTEEFKYRMEMIDRFLIDFFENPHEEIVNKIQNFKRVLSTLQR